MNITYHIERGADMYNKPHLSLYLCLYPLHLLAFIGNSISLLEWNHTMSVVGHLKTSLRPHPNDLNSSWTCPCLFWHHQIISTTKEGWAGWLDTTYLILMWYGWCVIHCCHLSLNNCVIRLFPFVSLVIEIRAAFDQIDQQSFKKI